MDVTAPYAYMLHDWVLFGQTKVTKAKGTKKVPKHWNKIHQRAFNQVKAAITISGLGPPRLFLKSFESYTNAFSKQLGAVITQDSRSFAFFSWNSPSCNANTVSPNRITSHSQNSLKVHKRY
jgi:hypothetical protein